MSFNYNCGRSFREVCGCLRINEKDADMIWNVLINNEGYTETALCYVAAVCENKLIGFIGDSRFASIYINEVHKRAMKPNDPRWETGKKKTIYER